MFKSYVGRLILIYSAAMLLVIGAIVGIYNNWLDHRLLDVSENVFLCDFCPVMDSFEEGGAEALINGLERRKAIHGLDYLLTDSGYAIAGSLNIHVLAKTGRFERRIASKAFGDSYLLHAEFFALTPEHPEQKLVNRKVRGIAGALTYFYGALLLIMGFVATLVITWRIQTKLKTINETAQFILKRGDLSQRIPVSGGQDEFDRLSTNLNTMLAGVENKVQTIRNISNNIAHDLRTPLTKLHNTVACANLNDHEKNEILQKIDQVINTFNALLRIEKLNSGVAQVKHDKIRLKGLLTDVSDFLVPIADQKQVHLEIKHQQEHIIGDRDLLFQALINLTENAIKHVPIGGKVQINGTGNEQNWTLCVIDNGDGIPNDLLDVAIEPFVRLNNSHRINIGTGLGLSLVKSIAEVHGGHLTIKNTEQGFVASISTAKT